MENEKTFLGLTCQDWFMYFGGVIVGFIFGCWIGVQI